MIHELEQSYDDYNKNIIRQLFTKWVKAATKITDECRYKTKIYGYDYKCTRKG